MSDEGLVLLIQLGFPFFLLIVTYLIGSTVERRHLADLRAREEAYRRFPVITFSSLPTGWTPRSTAMVHGSVVISIDYFKRFLAALRALVGGRIRAYEPLLDRARREAVLRMIEDARRRGFDAIINVRLETSRIANARRDGKSTAGVEMLAFGTALELGSSESPMGA